MMVIYTKNKKEPKLEQKKGIQKERKAKEGEEEIQGQPQRVRCSG